MHGDARRDVQRASTFRWSPIDVADPSRWRSLPRLARLPPDAARPRRRRPAAAPRPPRAGASRAGEASCHGTDNAALLDALLQGKGRYAGVAMIDHGTGDAEVDELHAAGVPPRASTSSATKPVPPTWNASTAPGRSSTAPRPSVAIPPCATESSSTTRNGSISTASCDDRGGCPWRGGVGDPPMS